MSELPHDVLRASKELRCNYAKMSSRLASHVNMDFCADETNSAEVSAYLRRKSSEGTGRNG